jgi:hypothetical protein
MAKGGDVLSMLIPQGGWVISGSDYDSIQWLECEPITKAQFELGLAQYDAWKAQQDSNKDAAKESAYAKLAALGLTADDLKALGL